MEARLSRGPVKVQNGVSVSRVNPKELTPETYEHYCRLYLIENIYETIHSTSCLDYGCVSKLINSIDPILFKNLNLETNKLLLLNKICNNFNASFAIDWCVEVNIMFHNISNPSKLSGSTCNSHLFNIVSIDLLE